MSYVDEEVNQFKKNFVITAIIQGRIAYFLMSLHLTNPNFLSRVLTIDPYPYLFANMVYGMAILIYSRPSLRTVNSFHRTTFSILGSLSFNTSSVQVFQWITEQFPERPGLRVFLSYLAGRILIVHLFAFFYHMDTRMFPLTVDSILGSLMMCTFSTILFEWIRFKLTLFRFLPFIANFVCGRIIMMYFVFILYHMDTRITTPDYQTDSLKPFELIILMSSMFCTASARFFDWLNDFLGDHKYKRMFIGVMVGRLFVIYLYAFFYHLDSRICEGKVNRIDSFENMLYKPWVREE